MKLAKNFMTVSPELMTEIHKAIKKNAAEDRRQTRTGNHTPNKIFIFDAKKKSIEFSRKRVTMRKHDDLYAASVVGALILRSKTGADAVLPIDDTTLELVELKLTCKSLNDCWVSSEILTDTKVLQNTNLKLTLYNGEKTAKSKSSVKSTIAASFEVTEHGNLSSKNRKTFLVIRDEDTDAVIDIRELDGLLVLNYLKKSIAAKPKIPYGYFVLAGKSFTGLLPTLGYDAWARPLLIKAAINHQRRRNRLLKKLSPVDLAQRLRSDHNNKRRLDKPSS
jgi:hypothetical protein